MVKKGMVDSSWKQRIRKIDRLVAKAEQIVAVERREREEYLAQLEEERRPQARRHAAAVAGIVLFGKPQIDEPLIHAWERALQHLGITLRDEYGRECQYEYKPEHNKHDDSNPETLFVNWPRFIYDMAREKAGNEMYTTIMQSANEIERFTEIFSTAPVWLLEFTWMRLDAGLLKFGLPRMSDKQVWGEDGLRDMMRWPLLPLGMMTDGDPLPEVAVEDGVPPEEEEVYRQHRRMHDFNARRFARGVGTPASRPHLG